MNASTFFAAVATLAFAGSAFATEMPAASAAATTAAATATTAAAAAAAAPAAAAAKSANVAQTRAKVRAEAVEAAGSRRATEASQFDWFMK